MNNEKWDRRFLEMAKLISTWSKDPSTQVGAVIVSGRNKVVGIGYNGFPRGILDNKERYDDRPTKYKLVVHAEVNALLDAGERAIGSKLYVYPTFAFPPVCSDCCKFAIQSGIVEIVGYDQSGITKEALARWEESIRISEMMCNEANVKITRVPL